MVIYKRCHPLSGQQIGDILLSSDDIFMRVLADERLVLINLPALGWLNTIRNDGIWVARDGGRGVPAFNHLPPGTRYHWPSSLSPARWLTRSQKFRQHTASMMESVRGSKAPINSIVLAPEFLPLTVLEQG